MAERRRLIFSWLSLFGLVNICLATTPGSSATTSSLESAAPTSEHRAGKTALRRLVVSPADEDQLWTPPPCTTKQPTSRPLSEGDLPAGWDMWHAILDGLTPVRSDADESLLVSRFKDDQWRWKGEVHEWEEKVPKDADGRSELHVYSDGGVQGEGREGRYGWIVPEFQNAGRRDGDGKPVRVAAMAGGGRFLAWEQRASSTRAETVALAAVTTAMAPLLAKGIKIVAHVDNATVVSTYKRGKHKSSHGYRVLYENGMCHYSLHLPKGELGSCPPSGAGPARPDGWSPIRSGPGPWLCTLQHEPKIIGCDLLTDKKTRLIDSRIGSFID